MALIVGSISQNGDSDELEIVPRARRKDLRPLAAATADKHRIFTENTGDGSGTLELRSRPRGTSCPWTKVLEVTLDSEQDFDAFPEEEFHLTLTGATAAGVNYWII